jgi:glycosyltransferase involved in cell wall biosynthesis
MFLHAVVLLLSYQALAIDTQSAGVCGKYGYEKSTLWMDVVYAMQGRSIDFTGFFVEFLGIAENVKTMMPLSRLIKSFYQDSLDEPVIKRWEEFQTDLFPSETSTIQHLIKNDHPMISSFPIREVEPHFRGNPNKSTAPWDFEQLCHADSFFVDSKPSSGELARNFYNLEVQTAQECCKVCVQQSLCLAWHFESHSNACQLYNQKSEQLIPSAGSISGRITFLVPNPNPPKDAPTPAMMKVDRSPRPRAIIYHGTTCAAFNISAVKGVRDIHTIRIGRYMVERNQFSQGQNMDEYALGYCATYMDELWVPTAWHKQFFHDLLLQRGYRGIPITIVPEAVDTTLFAPDRLSSEVGLAQINVDGTSQSSQDSSPSSYETHHTARKGCHFVNVEGNDDSTYRNQPSLVCQSTSQNIEDRTSSVSTIFPISKKFEFLSIFKWETRKGWEVLLQAYWSAFQPSDDVILTIHSYIPHAQRFHTSNLTLLIEEYAQKTLGKSLFDLPAVRILDDIINAHTRNGTLTRASLSRAQMRDIYQRVDAFVLPTKGEGWGLPIAEAMAMELPVIVTNYSGPTAYATSENAYLLDIEDELDELSFAKPKIDHLRVLFRQLVHETTTEGNYIALKKGKEARKTMQSYSGESIVCTMIERLRVHAFRRGWVF